MKPEEVMQLAHRGEKEGRVSYWLRPISTTPINSARLGVGSGAATLRPELAVGLRDKHSSDRIRLVALLPERKRQFAKPPLDAIRLDVREVLTVYTRCALIGAALGKRMGQNVLTADLVVQRVEAIAGFCLRFRVQRRLQFLNSFRS
jgi:hypothetical protein